MAKATKGGKKGRKIGRNKRAPANARYLGEQRWIKNKEKKIIRHLKKHPNDKQSEERISRDSSWYKAKVVNS